MKTVLAIAEIPFLNCAPFYWSKRLEGFSPDIEWIRAHPRELGNLAREGRVDAGPVSLLDTIGLEETYEPLPFGITAKDRAQSVILFSKRPPERLHEERIGLTSQSSTSTELLKVILREKFRVAPIFSTGFSEQDDARLWIGDQALFAMLDPLTSEIFPYRTDLGFEWKKWKGRSFVFARWMVKKDLSEEIKAGIARWLSESVAQFKKDPDQAIDRFEKMRGWKLSNAKTYLEGFNYSLTESDCLGSLAAFGQFSGHLAASRS